MMWDNFGYDMMDGSWFGIMFFLWAIVIIIVIALVIWFIVKLVKTNSVKSHFDSDTSLTILKERLAKGEITTEEFNQLKNVISKR